MMLAGLFRVVANRYHLLRSLHSKCIARCRVQPDTFPALANSAPSQFVTIQAPIQKVSTFFQSI